MKVIDLTHTISETMPVYPGTEQPRLTPANSYEKDGFKETLLSMYSHTGTHVDPPAHLFAGRTTLDAFPVSQFVGRAVVINCRHLKEGEAITMREIARAAPMRKRRTICCSTLAGTRAGARRNIMATIPA